MDYVRSNMRKSFWGIILCAAFVMILPSWVYGDSAAYPTRAITITVPYPPGGVTDLGARALAEAMEKHLGKPVTVMNRPGGSTTIGGNAVVTAKPDGYTLGFFPSSASIPEVYTYFYQAPYSGKNLKPVCKVAIPILTLSVRGDSPINSVKDLVEYAHKQPSVKVAVHNKTTAGFCAMKAIAKAEKVKLIDVPFDGDAKIVPAILGGHVPVGTPAYPGVQSLVAAKQIKVLAILVPKRAEFAPNIPSITESGYNLPLGTYLGVFAPKNTPDHIVKKLNDVIATIAQEPEFRKKVHAMGIQVMFEPTSSFEKSIKEYADNLSAFFKEEGLAK